VLLSTLHMQASRLFGQIQPMLFLTNSLFRYAAVKRVVVHQTATYSIPWYLQANSALPSAHRKDQRINQC